MLGGAFMGNSINLDPSKRYTTNAFQEVNPLVLGIMSEYYNKPGADMLHEVTESYKGAKFSQAFGKSFLGSAGERENDDPFSIYNLSHYSATPQTATEGYGVRLFDKNGNTSSVLYQSGRAEYYIIDPTGKKKEQIIQNYPHP